MPKMDGIQCLRHIKEDKDGININTPVIVLTANAVSGSRKMYLDAGFDNYLTKPIDSETLENMMSTFLPVSKVRAAGLDHKETETLPDWIRNAPFIDSGIGIKNCGGVKSFISALEAYADGFESNRQEITKAKAEGRIRDYTTKVHALKSSSRIIGAMKIGELAEHLEMAGNAKDLNTINVYTDELLSYYSTLYYLLKQHIQIEEELKSKPFITPGKLKEAYVAIREIAQFFDYDTVTNIIDSLKEYSIPDNEKDKYKALLKAVANADWDEINNILKG